MPGAATVQPATLARGLRRVLLERGVTIHEGTTATEIDGQRPGWLGALGAGTRRAPRRRGAAGGPRPVRVRTTSAAGDGEVLAGSAVLALNAWAGAWPWFGPRLVTWSSYIVLTEPIPDRLADIGWTGGEGVADARFTLHYLRTTPDGRIAIGGGGGRAGFAGRIGPAFTDSAADAARAAAGLRRLFPSLRDVRIEDAWGGPIDISADHLPWFGSVRGRPIHYGHGYSGNGVGPAVVGGRILAARAVERADDPALALALADGRSAAAVPAGTGELPWRAADPRGRRPARIDGGAWREARIRASRGQPVAQAARLSPGAGIAPLGPQRRTRPEQESAKSAIVSTPRRT